MDGGVNSKERMSKVEGNDKERIMVRGKGGDKNASEMKGLRERRRSGSGNLEVGIGEARKSLRLVCGGGGRRQERTRIYTIRPEFGVFALL